MEQNNTPPPQLSKEVLEKIHEEADKYAFVVPYDGSNKFYNDDKLYAYIAGATAWATRCAQMAEALKEISKVHGQYHKLNGDNPAANHLRNIAIEALTAWTGMEDKHKDGRKCTDCGTYFVSTGRCPECNPMG